MNQAWVGGLPHCPGLACRARWEADVRWRALADYGWHQGAQPRFQGFGLRPPAGSVFEAEASTRRRAPTYRRHDRAVRPAVLMAARLMGPAPTTTTVFPPGGLRSSGHCRSVNAS